MTEYYAEPYTGACGGCGTDLTTRRRTPMGDAAPEAVWVRCGECEQVTRLQQDHE